ncbi:MAG: hypothetical protein WA958_19430 [Tunicatimonas sp.]
MQQPYDTVLCRSEHGCFAGFPHGLTYALTYQSISLHLTEEEVDQLRHHLDTLPEHDWFRLPSGRFTLLSIPRLGGCFYLEEAEVHEIIGLLGEAAVMIKVHQCLLHRLR